MDNKSKNKSKSVVFLSLDAHGHVNAMLGLAEALKALHFQTIFVCNDNQAPKHFGHELVLVRKWQQVGASKESKPSRVEEPEQGIEDEESVFVKNEQLNAKWAQMVDLLDLDVSRPDCVQRSLTHNYHLLKLTIEHEIIPLDEKVEEILCYLKPSLVVVDTLCPYPALHRLSNKNNPDYAKKRGFTKPLNWISFTSCNPMLHYNAHFAGQFPPPLMGLSTKEIAKKGAEMELEQLKYEVILKESGMLEVIFKLASLAHLNLNQATSEPVQSLLSNFSRNQSPLLNIYMFPYELDYCRDNEQFNLPAELFLQVDSFVRKPLAVVEGNKSADEILLSKVAEWRHQSVNNFIVYVSLGTTMSYNMKLLSELCKQVFTCLESRPEWRFALSLGARSRNLEKSLLDQIDQWQAKKRLVTASWFPQPLLMGRNLIDACVTHGGNNTLCELFQFKVAPRLVLIPAFHDQLDNARRVTELGLGVAIPASKLLNVKKEGKKVSLDEEQEKDNCADLLLRSALEKCIELGSEFKVCAADGPASGGHYNNQLRDSNYCARFIETKLRQQSDS